MCHSKTCSVRGLLPLICSIMWSTVSSALVNRNWTWNHHEETRAHYHKHASGRKYLVMFPRAHIRGPFVFNQSNLENFQQGLKQSTGLVMRRTIMSPIRGRLVHVVSLSFRLLGYIFPKILWKWSFLEGLVILKRGKCLEVKFSDTAQIPIYIAWL